MERLKLVIAWEGLFGSACALAVAVTMVWRDIAWPMGFVIGGASLGLFAVSHRALARLRSAER